MYSELLTFKIQKEGTIARVNMLEISGLTNTFFKRHHTKQQNVHRLLIFTLGTLSILDRMVDARHHEIDNAQYQLGQKHQSSSVPGDDGK